MDSQDTYWSQSQPSSQRSRYGVSSSQIAARRRMSMRKMRNPKGKRAFKSAVKRAVGSVAETKCLQTANTLTVRCLQALTSDPQFNAAAFCVTPQGAVLGAFTQGYGVLANGIGQDQRIGDRVTIKATYLDFIITANGYNASTNPAPQAQVVTVWVVRPKSGARLGLPSTDILAGSANCKLFEFQSNAESGLEGRLTDMIRKVDTDNYKVLARRTYKIGYQGSLSTTNVVQSFQQNDFQQFAKDRIKLRPEDWRVNRQEVYEGLPVYMFVTSVNADGTLANAAYIPVSFNFNCSVYYTDL